MENRAIKIIIADDHTLLLESMQAMLASEQDIIVEAVAETVRDLMDTLRRQLPDIILLDIKIPKPDGFQALKYVRQSYPAIKVIILSSYDEGHYIEKARELGASGYLVKSCPKKELVNTIRLVFMGQSCFPDRKQAVPGKLSTRELEIIQLLKLHYTNRQIAEKLARSLFTIETHRKNIMKKLELTKPSELMRYIIENDL